MTSTDGSDGGPNPQTPAPRGRAELFVDVLKATGIPLVFGLLSLLTLLMLWWYGLPARPISLVILSVTIGGPFIVAYSFLFAHVYQSRIDVPVVLVDPDGNEWGLKYIHPDEFGAAEIEGDRLATRTGRATGETIYFAEGHRIEQREEVDRKTGDTETVAKRILESTWEAEVSTQEFLEKKTALEEQRKRLIPYAYDGLKARAGADMQALENTDRLAHSLLLGAEDDTFLAAGTNPFDFDVEVDPDRGLDGLIPRRSETDDQEAREDAGRPGAHAVQEASDPLDERAQPPETGHDHRENGHPSEGSHE
mgnify:CR=1 FL=1